MADNVIPVEFPVAAVGQSLLAPPGSLKTGKWRKLHNLYPVEGVLAKRPRVDSDPTWGSGVTHTLKDGVQDGNRIIAIWTVPRRDLDPFFSAQKVNDIVVVTEQELCWGDSSSGSFVSITPEYSVGTVDVQNGSPTVQLNTGSPVWADRGISSPNIIQLPDTNWYRISSATNSAITLTSNYQGGTLTNQSYLIRRTWNLDTASIVQIEEFNGDIYVMGPFGQSYDTIVLKIAAYEETSPRPGPSDVSMVFGGAFVYESGLDYVNYYFYSKGMKFLPDGRMVMAGGWGNNAQQVVGASRVLYSSPASVSTWSTSPGGAFDAVSRSGEVTGLGSIQGQLTLHWNNGIDILTLTGLDDPPLSVSPTDVDTGALRQPLLQEIDGREWYVGSDMAIHAFDGRESPAISKITQAGYDSYYVNWSSYLCWDSFRRNLRAMTATENGATVAYCINLETGDEWTEKYEVALHCSAPVFSFFVADGGRGGPATEGTGFHYEVSQRGHVGLRFGGDTLRSTDNLSDATFGLYFLQEVGDAGDVRDDASNNAVTVDGYYAITDALDFDIPGIHKYVDHVTLWLKSFDDSNETLTAQVTLMNEKGQSETVSKSLSIVNTSDNIPRPYHFFFKKRAGVHWYCKVNLGNGVPPAATPDYTILSALTKMTFWVVPKGRDEVYE